MNICIIGASSGIGLALSRRLAGEGHRGWGIARRKEALQSLERSLPAGSFQWSAGDISEVEDMASATETMRSKGFLADAVIIAAAIFNDDLKDGRHDFAAGKRVFEVNVFGVMHCIEMFLDDFLAKKNGHFVILSSIAAFRPGSRGIAYPATKAAVSLVSRGFGLAMRGTGVLFSTVYLGPVSSPMWEGKAGFPVITPEQAAEKISKILVSRRSTYYIPFFSTMIARMSRVLSDRMYARLRNILFK